MSEKLPVLIPAVDQAFEANQKRKILNQYDEEQQMKAYKIKEKRRLYMQKLRLQVKSFAM